MTERSSLDLLIQISQSEREAQLSHFDSLDTKAGLVLGFAGVLIALGNGSRSVIGLVAIAFAALSRHHGSCVVLAASVPFDRPDPAG